MTRNRIATAILAAVVGTVPLTALADGHWRGDHRDMRHFEARDAHHWASGHWYHGEHGGRIGWWWVVGGAIETALWYSYPRPVYPYPDPYVPPTVVIQAAPAPAPTVAVPAPQVAAPAPPTVWYFCGASGKYYPYVATCPEGWMTVPASPPGR